MFIAPLVTPSPSATSRGRLSPVSAEVSSKEAPDTTTPSNGIFSPGFTTMIPPFGTRSGATRSKAPPSSQWA